MRTISIRALSKVLLPALIVVVFSSLTYSQQAAQDESLGNVARENRAAQQNQKTAPAKKIYHNSSVSSPTGTSTDSTKSNTSATPANASPPQNDASTSSGATEGHPGDTTSVFDRPKKRHDRSDFFIVPASTEIRVSVEHRDGAPPSSAVEIGKVVLPVRIGFADAIPVFSKVTFGPVGIGTFSVLDYRDNFGLLYELTTVTVGTKTYKIHTDALPYSPEMRFTLAKPLWIKR